MPRPQERPKMAARPPQGASGDRARPDATIGPMARVSLIERARARTRRNASTGSPVSHRQAQSLRQILQSHGHSVGARGNPAMHLAALSQTGGARRPAGAQVASPVIRQYLAGYSPRMAMRGGSGQYPPGVPGVPDPRGHSVGRHRFFHQVAMAASTCSSHGQCGPLQECKDGTCVDMDLVAPSSAVEFGRLAGVAGGTRQRALRRLATQRTPQRLLSVGGCGCKAY